MNRVVVTGMAGITSLGETTQQIFQAMNQQQSGVRYMPEWEQYPDLNTKLAAPVTAFSLPTHFTRKTTRGMGRVALLSVVAAEQALEDAGLRQHPVLTSGKAGVAFGSSSGSVDAVMEMGEFLIQQSSKRINATTYIRMMSHTSAVNMTVHFGLQGLTLPTSSACTSGSMAIGQAYEAIKYGKQTVMLAGGAEELSAAGAAVFDVLFATSCKNATPQQTPQPFDLNRDGLVIGEGSACLILEDYQHAQARGAKIYAEIIGYGSNTDGQHVTRPESEQMGKCMQLALDDADISAQQIDYVNAHGTATEQGDIAETQATASILGIKPISSLKSYFGHTLGACGAIEAWLSIAMMNHNQFVPTLNLQQIDERCGNLDYITGESRSICANYVMSNNFAFGGINTSLIFKKIN
ncbi:beta-ketoacyl-ACP synthase [Acinetobacter qingfengensis]|uniref:Beta-ketoacyl-ACP synthase II n=1 Tax=Acinetobacter qingfengensis TaxID=1262585 RepID=A0A1E7R2W1_9GAMM|nr:beta-ketoacyl-ACP synthase [Acinetobacter qingfengensis]KAA8733864.1 beta-ketoacyl-ACP synthase [Acinetobacter qingfengensis]OEY93623.1 beta-ketoacyl-ACP synthase II [Acinetobacter qingfengensis]